MSIKTGHYAVSNFHAEIDGKSAGYLSSFQPPTYEREEITSALGPDWVSKKMMGNPKIGECTAVYNISQAGEWLSWCETVWKKQCVEKDLVISLADQDYNIKRGIEMLACTITGIEWPALKATEKSDFKVTAKFQPQRVNYVKGTGKAQGQLGQKAKAWQPANFKVHEFAGLKTQWITSQELCKMTPKIAKEHHGQFALPLLNYASIDMGPVKTEIGSAGYQPAEDLAKRILQDGSVEEGEFQTIIIDMLDPTLKNTLGTFTLIGCGLSKFEWSPKLEGGKDSLSVCTLTWLVEEFQMEVKHK